eukprot:3941822-Amphidinium_carterae.1
MEDMCCEHYHMDESPNTENDKTHYKLDCGKKKRKCKREIKPKQPPKSVPESPQIIEVRRNAASNQ